MSIFKAPETVISRIDKIRRSFLWGCENGKRTMAKVKWKQVCLPKSKGGIRATNIKAKKSSPALEMEMEVCY